MTVDGRKGNTMNWDQVEGNWKQFKGRAQEKWGRLTDDDTDVAAGDRERFEGILQERYGKTKEEARREVDEWLAEH
ncbi:CsbD family protein [Palleronia aestuarii]